MAARVAYLLYQDWQRADDLARPYQSLCVPQANGLSVYFQLYRAQGDRGFTFGGAAQLFRHHLHLLGPDPANWTTRPLG